VREFPRRLNITQLRELGTETGGMSLRIDGALVPDPPAAPPHPSDSTEPAGGAEGPSAFAQILTQLGQSVDAGEHMVGGVASGKFSGSDPATLIALQAGIYRYSEVVDLAGKLVDRAGNGVRSVLQGGH
jgi:hypothetical protein